MKRKMTKILAAFLAVLMVALSLPMSAAVDTEEYYGYTYTSTDGVVTIEINYTYTVENGEATIIHCMGFMYVDEDENHLIELQDIFIPDTLDGYPVTGIGEEAFVTRYSLTNIDIPDSVTSIGARAFAHCDNLTSIDLPDSLTAIGEQAFFGCFNLSSIEIPNGVTSIGNDAFYSCASLAEINVDADNKAYSSEDGVLFDKDKTVLIRYPQGKPDTSYIIPDAVTDIGETAFEYCSSLTSIDIPDSVTSIGEAAFDYCSSITEINVDVDNKAYSSEDGVLFNKDKTVLIHYPRGKSDASYNIPDSVTTIGDGAFSNCVSLTSIDIPNSVTSIGDLAFFNCASLTSINIPDSVTSIGYGAFYYCTSLESVTIGNGVTSIGDSAFYDCTSLESVTIGNSVTSIGYKTFFDCTSLESIKFLNKDTEIYDSIHTIGSSATIYGYTNSTAQAYAERHNKNFVSLGDSPDTTEPDTTEPDTTEPDTTEPDTTEPDTTEPDTTEPDTTEPDEDNGDGDSGFGKWFEVLVDLIESLISLFLGLFE